MSSLIRKLGIKEGHRIHVTGAPLDVLAVIQEVSNLKWVRSGEEADYLHIFATREDGLVRLLDQVVEALSTQGMLWVSWPKKSSGEDTDLNREVVREILLETGLVDIKVCAINETWSGLKFVHRLKDRK